ncbi:hypothetical protein ACD591_09190 [Rufibacter glacialis]|uniref:Uncharacterized protein n=1 Tax=Rufibacter glacialis TaxID=1259555 RepID=A0ABV4REA6_9BACT|nr:hypothetical protein [Rufibacter glacialis]GGK78296.1 hypothetical protein GCM10011405_27690 [Rufibacter glacialis]
MNVPKSILSAILIGISVQATSCVDEEELPKPKQEQSDAEGKPKTAGNCLSCGMG